MKRLFQLLFITFLLVAGWCAWNIFGPVVNAPEDKYFFIKTGADYEFVQAELINQKIISGTFFFNKIAQQLKYPQQVKAGRYAIKDGTSVLALVRMFKSGNQSPVKLVINKLRTKEDLAAKLAYNFEFDTTEVLKFIMSDDSLKTFNCDTNTVMTNIIPNTYELKWNGNFKRIFVRLVDERKKFWNTERQQKAAIKKLTPVQVYILASIVEEESNNDDDRKLIASVYINRIYKNMRMQADPTVKYAMRDFSLKRILFGHLKYPSPYNTYQVTGLPPGPICTPSPNAIDAVLNAPVTNYIFFAATPSFNGKHNFSETYVEHQTFAKQYQQALDSLIISRNNK